MSPQFQLGVSIVGLSGSDKFDGLGAGVVVVPSILTISRNTRSSEPIPCIIILLCTYNNIDISRFIEFMAEPIIRCESPSANKLRRIIGNDTRVHRVF